METESDSAAICSVICAIFNGRGSPAVFGILARMKLSFCYFCAGRRTGHCKSFKPPFRFSAFQFNTSSIFLPNGRKSSMTEESWADDIANGQLLRWALKCQILPSLSWISIYWTFPCVLHVCSVVCFTWDVFSKPPLPDIFLYSVSFCCHSLFCLS